MQIAFFLFEGITALDAVGPYEVLQRLPGAEVVFVATEPGPKRTDNGALALTADASIDDVTSPDILVVPGGFGTRALMHDEAVLEWVRAVHETSTWTTSVCTGSLVLGRRRPARGAGGHHPLEPARRAGEVRRQAHGPAGGRAGQDRHRRRRVVGHRHGPHARRARSPATTSPRPSSSASSTTPSRPSTPAHPRRRRRKPSI